MPNEHIGQREEINCQAQQSRQISNIHCTSYQENFPTEYLWARGSQTSVFLKHNYIGHDDVIKWKHFPRYWPFVRGIHRSPVNSPHKGQWRGAFDIFFHLRLNKQLSKQSWGWWFETPSRPLWRHCNKCKHFPVIIMKINSDHKPMTKTVIRAPCALLHSW